MTATPLPMMAGAVATAQRLPVDAIRTAIACVVMGAAPAVLADTRSSSSSNSSAAEPVWQTLDRSALQKMSESLYFDDRWLLYELSLKRSRLVMTAQASGKRIELALSIRPTGQIDDSEGGRTVVQARQGELRMCTADASPDCWSLRRTRAQPKELSAEEMEQRLQANAETAIATCGLGRVREVRVTGFSCKASTP